MENFVLSVAKHLLLILLLSMNYGTIWAQFEGTFEQPNYFEGMIYSKITLGGKYGQAFIENKPNTQMVMMIKEGDYIVNLSGGQRPVSRIFIADSNRMYIMDPKNKTAFKNEGNITMQKKLKKDTTVYVAIPTYDSLKILGNICYGFLIKKKDEEIKVYITPKYRVNLAHYNGKKNADAMFVTPGIYGCIPLKTIRITKDLTTEITVTKISEKSLDKKGFGIPPDWKVDYRDYR